MPVFKKLGHDIMSIYLSEDSCLKSFRFTKGAGFSSFWNVSLQILQNKRKAEGFVVRHGNITTLKKIQPVYMNLQLYCLARRGRMQWSKCSCNCMQELTKMIICGNNIVTD